MKDYKYIMFDLDGTVTDPKEGITASVQYALRHLGIEPPDRDALCSFIGPPLAYSFERMFGLTGGQVDIAIEKYRENYRGGAVFDCTVYDGIPQLLSWLRDTGRTVMLATSKPTVFANMILEKFGIARYFDVVCGSELSDKSENKSRIMEKAIRQAGAEDRSSVLMIGDRKFDVIGSRDNGVDCVGVLFGYGSEEELREAGATYIASSVDGIKEIIGG